MARSQGIVCRSCGDTKPRTTEFWKPCRTCADGLRRTCRECTNAAQRKRPGYAARDAQASRAYRQRNRDRINAQRSKTRLIAGLITAAEYDDMLKAQGGACAICECVAPMRPSPGHIRRRAFHVDHDHKTGRVRGLLCGKCNAGLGFFQDSFELLKKALNYLASQ